MKEGPREQQLREMREAKARKPNPFEDAARGRDVPRNTPEASGTARKAPGGKAVSASAPMTDPKRNLVRASPNPVAKATKGKAGTAVVTGHVRRSTTGTGLQVGEADAVRPATSEFMDATAGETAPNSKRGRPRKPDSAPISRATRYRRRKAEGTLP